MPLNFLWLLASLALVIQSANVAVRYATKLAESFRLSKYVTGFLVVAVISILPETFISITAAAAGVPSFGLGTLFGGNVADLTLIFAVVVLAAGRSLQVESKVIKNRYLYIGAIAVPIVLGLNGHYARWEGWCLLAAGLAFYFYVLRKNFGGVKKARAKFKLTDALWLLLSMGLLLLGAHWTVKLGVGTANDLGINHVLVGMFIVALGTTLPELLFAIKAARRRQDGLALGDILGTVIADATILVGLIALIQPFAFNPRIIYVSGLFMLSAIIVLFYLMKTGRALSRQEAMLLLVFYGLFVAAEWLIN